FPAHGPPLDRDRGDGRAPFARYGCVITLGNLCLAWKVVRLVTSRMLPSELNPLTRNARLLAGVRRRFVGLTVMRWRVRTPASRQGMPAAIQRRQTTLAFRPDARVAASGSGDGTLRRWDTELLAERSRALVAPRVGSRSCCARRPPAGA